MSIVVKKIAAKSEDFERFLGFRKVLYPQNNPIHFIKEDFDYSSLHQLFLLEEEGEIVARAALYFNQALNWNGEKALSIGNYEAYDRPDAIPLLFQTIEEESKKMGVTSVLGPMNGSTWFSYRYAENTLSPFLFEPIHSSCYHHHFKMNGFERIAEYFSSKVGEIPGEDGNFALLRVDFEQDFGVKFRTIDLDYLEQELEAVFPFLECSFNNNFLFTPITKEKFITKYLEVKPVINADFTYLAEDEKGNIIGCIFCVDDQFNTQEKVLIIKTIARDPHPKWKNLGQVIGNIIYRKAKDKGYDAIIHALMEKTANSSPASQKFGGKPINNYFLYGKKLI